MKSLKTTGIIVLAFALLLAYVYFFESGEQVTSEELARKIFQFNADEVQEVSLESAEEHVVLTRGENGDWFINAPGSPVKGPFAADKNAVTNLVETVADLEAERRVLDKTDDLSEYGLDSPSCTVKIKTKNGAEKTLLLGTQAPVGGGKYAKVEGSDPVYMLDSYSTSILTRDLQSLRNKQVVSFSLEEVSRLKLAGRINAELVKESVDWRIEQPFSDSADQYTANSIVDAFRYLRVEEFVNDSPDEKALQEYGLDEPQVTATFTLGKDTDARQVTVFIGKTPDEGSFYVKRGDSPSVYLVKDSTFKPLTMTLDDILDKDLLDFDPSEAEELSFESKDYTANVKRVSNADETSSSDKEQWTVNGKKATDDAITEIWYQLRYMDAVTRVGDRSEQDKFGLEKPDVHIKLQLKNGEEITVFAVKQEDKVYVTVSNRSGVYLVEKDILNTLREKIENAHTGGKEEANEKGTTERGTD